MKACSLAPSTLRVSPLTRPSHLRCVLYCSLQVKLTKYICKQLQCKQKVPETERPEALDSYPHLRDWLRTVNLRPELIEVGRVASPSRPGPGSLCLGHVYVDSACVLSARSRVREERSTGDRQNVFLKEKVIFMII